MAHIARILRLLFITLSVAALSVTALDASAGVQKAEAYGRFIFNFKEPAKLKTTSSGATATLVFDKPVRESAESISRALPDYVRYATISEDKKRITLTLFQPYRVRQFISGSGVGIDLVGAPTDEKSKTLANKAEPQKPHEPSEAEKMAAEEPSAADSADPSESESDALKSSHNSESNKQKAAATKKAEESKPTKPTQESTPKPPAAKASQEQPKQDSMLSTKAVEPVKPTNASPTEAAKASEVAAPKATPTLPVTAAKADPMLSTKAAEPAKAPESNPEQKVEKASVAATSSAELAPAVASVKKDSILTTKAVQTEQPAPTTKPAEPQAKPVVSNSDTLLSTKEPQAPTAPAASNTERHEPSKVASVSKPDSSAPTTVQPSATTAKPGIQVAVKTSATDTTLTFPWNERTALAVFKRSRDIWVIFSRPTQIDLASLRANLPKQIINTVQYAYEGNTILRFSTDGSLNVSAQQAKGNYNWKVVFAAKSVDPSLDVPLSADTLDGTTRLVLGIFDVAPTVKFYDPTVGDMLLAIPSYENSRGINPPRSFPEFSILPNNQGVALISKRLDLVTHQTRSGLIISAPGGLAISDTLPTLTTDAPTVTDSGIPAVMMPYSQWHVKGERFVDALNKRIKALSQANKVDRPARFFDLAKLYLSEGMMPEAAGILDIIRKEAPSYYVANRFALLHGACYVLMNRYDEARRALDAPELKDMEEAVLWRQALALSTPQASLSDTLAGATIQRSTANGETTPINAINASAIAPQAGGGEPIVTDSPTANGNVFQLLKFNKQFIRFYPPRIRQQLTLIASDAYIRNKQPEKALAAFDILLRDGIVAPIKQDEKLALAAAAVKKGQIDSALDLYDALGKQDDNQRVSAKARYAAAKLRYDTKKIDGAAATDLLENIRYSWHGKPIERDILDDLVRMYIEQKRYDQVLRTQKAILDNFPDDPNSLKLSADMSDLFQHIFLDGLGDEMDPLKALSLFYEFRELTPLGTNGDRMIQKLADRLAAVDLLGRATQLLEHQVKFRLTGEQRSHVGTRLALLYLLNKQPNEALSALEVTNFGGNKAELLTQRQQLLAATLNALGKNEEALNALYQDKTPEGASLRLEILWSMQDWPNVANRAEDILTSRPNLTDLLTPKETETLLKLALAYTFQGDYVQLRYLRDYYSGLIPNSGYKQIFDYITNDTTPLDPDDFKLVAEQISHTESFLDTFKSKIAQGKLSEVVK